MASPTFSPHFITARSAKALRRLLLKNNIEHNAIFNYQIVHDGKAWFAWYQFDAVESLAEDVQRLELEEKVQNKS